MALLPPLIAFSFALLTAWILSKIFGAPPSSGRFASIDGLRGYLAFGVFTHHGAVWYDFLHTGEWRLPSSFIYTNLGQASVVLFFMITGFLFCTKVLRGRSERINWYKLYLSRLLRLLPLYTFAILLMLLTVGIITRFQLVEPAFLFSKSLFKWASFTVMGYPDLNGLKMTSIIVGTVTWTLPYEWFFYFILPLIAVLAGAATPRRFILGALLIVAFMIYRMRPDLVYLATFFGGIVAAVLVHFDLIHKACRGIGGSIAASISLLVAITCFRSAYQFIPIVLLTVAFTMIAAENTLFGILAWPTSRFLGQLTYSIYLLHGIMLFWIFRFVIGFAHGASLSLVQHWSVMCLSIPFLISGCYATFRFIELPGMRSVSRFVSWYHEHLNPVMRRYSHRIPARTRATPV
ncbi:MAG: acyltransferase family protein [Chthoniobacterales bacterium]